MIRLRRGSKPAILDAKAAEWTKAFVEHQGPLSQMRAADRFTYRHPDIKAAIKRDALEKCMYCESKITHVHPGEVEHILPASLRRDLAVEWENLGFVCTECNREKRDYYEPVLPLIDPYREDPAKHLVFYGPTVLHRTGSARGELTVQRLKLNRRLSLLERRAERIEQLQGLLDRIDAMDDGPLKAMLEEALQDEVADDKEYAATSREFVRQVRAA